MLKQRFHIPYMYRKRSRNYRGNKAHWLIHSAGQDADSSCSKSAFQPLQRCAPANPLRSQSAKLGHEFAVSVPWDLCSSSHANFTTSLKPKHIWNKDLLQTLNLALLFLVLFSHTGVKVLLLSPKLFLSPLILHVWLIRYQFMLLKTSLW